jgi:hypothetical protein
MRQGRAARRSKANNYILTVFDSCRYNSFQRARPRIAMYTQSVASKGPGLSGLSLNLKGREPTAPDLFGIATPEWMEGKPLFASA